MTNADTEARAKYYTATGTPTCFFNGMQKTTGGGGIWLAEKKYHDYRALIDPLLDEPAPVTVLFHRHLFEHFGGRRVIFVKAVGEIGVNTRVLLLVADGEGQNLALGEIVEIAHGFCPRNSRVVYCLGAGHAARPRARTPVGVRSLLAPPF